MKIKRIEAIAISLPLTRPFKMAGVEIRDAENVLVRVESDSGVVGWGEAASAPHMTGETLQSMTAAVRYMAPGLLGLAAEDFAGASRKMDEQMYGNQGAKAAVEMALHDAVGRAQNKPVYELLGGRKRDRIPVLWMLSSGDTERDVAEARERKAMGFVAYKIKVGVASPEPDAERTRRICEALNGNVLISADANQGWSVEDAERYVRAVADTTLDFFEQPVRGDDLAGMARVAAASRIAIGADEGIHSMADIQRHHDAKAAKGLSLKTIKLGGMQPVMRGGRLCESLGMEVNLACKIAESSIATAAVVHLASALPSVNWGVSLSSQYLAADIATPLTVEQGHVAVPTGPGLGITVDEARVKKHQLSL